MNLLSLALTALCLTHSAFAALTVEDKNKLATVTLHTELIESSKRVYLAADFEARHDKGIIGCELKLTHKNGLSSGPTFHLEETTTLLPKESIPFNLGLFPDRFHASGLDVKAELVCRRVTYFESLKSPKPLLKSSASVQQFCCRMSTLILNCATEPEGGVEVNKTTQLTLAQQSPSDYPSCYPEK